MRIVASSKDKKLLFFVKYRNLWKYQRIERIAIHSDWNLNLKSQCIALHCSNLNLTSMTDQIEMLIKVFSFISLFSLYSTFSHYCLT